MLLLDTNVVSELRKVATGRADPSIVVWNETVDPAETFISSVVCMSWRLASGWWSTKMPPPGRCCATG